MVRTVLIVSVLFALVTCGLAQNRPGVSLLGERVSDHVLAHSTAQRLTASRYMPLILFRGIGSWASPQSSILIDGVPFGGFPLNRITPDFVPVDLITTEQVETIARPSLVEGFSLPGGGIDVRRSSIPDSFLVVARAFGGAETGDPILQTYTKDNLRLYNKNKIGYSAATSISQRSGELAYRVTGGVFGYFTAGYVGRDDVLIAYKGRQMLGRQNRNYLGAAELDYALESGATLSFYGGINGLVGWEQMPFLPILGFFSGYLHTLRVSAKNLPAGFFIHARRDGVYLSMKEQLGTEEGEYSMIVSSIYTVWSTNLWSGASVTATAELTRTAIVGSGQPKAQFFLGDHDELNYAASVGFGFHPSDAFEITATTRYDRGFGGREEFSGHAGFMIRMANDHEAAASLSSVATFPNLLERQGSFVTVRDRASIGRQDTFRIQGNPGLVPARVHNLALQYGIRSSTLDVSAEGFIIGIERSIERSIFNAIRTAWPGDVVYSGRYINASKGNLWGLEIRSRMPFTDEWSANMSYQYVESKTIQTVPVHSFHMTNELLIVQGTLLSFVIRGVSRTRWKEFVVLPQDDEMSGSGIDGVVSEYWAVDLLLEQRLGKIWFGRNVIAKMEIQNVFNRTVKVMPIGISFDTSVIGYVAFTL